MLQSLVQVTVKFQLHDIDGCVGLDENIQTALGIAYLRIDIAVEEREHHVKHCCEVAFRCRSVLQRVLLVGNRREIAAGSGQGLVDVAVHQCLGDVPAGIAGWNGIALNIERNENAHQSHLDFLIGISKRVHARPGIIVFYRQVTALIEQRQHVVHVLCRSVKVFLHSFAAVNLSQVGMELPHHVDKERRRAGGEPIVVEFTVVHCR